MLGTHRYRMISRNERSVGVHAGVGLRSDAPVTLPGRSWWSGLRVGDFVQLPTDPLLLRHQAASVDTAKSQELKH